VNFVALIKHSHLQTLCPLFDQVNGETSSFECAHELGKLCENRSVVVNLIPYNPSLLTMEEKNHNPLLSSPPVERIAEFQRIVQSYGCLCFVRKTMGQDILGACGQLAALQQPALSRKEGQNGAQDISFLDPPRSAYVASGKAAVVKQLTQNASIGTSVSSMDANKEGNIEQGSAVKLTKTETQMSTKASIEKKIMCCCQENYDLSTLTLTLIIGTSISAACLAISGALLLTRRRQ
jgi:hypothetical protein